MKNRFFQTGQGAENVSPNRETVNLGQAAESRFRRVRIPEFYSVQRGARELSLSGFSLPPYREAGNPGPESQFVVRILDFSGQCRPAVLGDFWQNQKKFISQDSALAKKSRKCESGPSSHFLVPIPAFSTDKAGWGALQEKDIATASSTLRAALCPTGAFRSDRGEEVHPGKGESEAHSARLLLDQATMKTS